MTPARTSNRLAAVVLAVILLLMMGGAVSGDLAYAVASRSSDLAWRSGTVTAVDATTVTVDVGGSQLIAMPYLASYQPVLGDPVEVLGQGGRWLVLGTAAGTATSLLANASFELDSVGAAPSNWGIYNNPIGAVTASVTVQSGPFGFELDGHRVVRVSNGATSGISYTHLYSDPIAVTPGDQLAAAAMYIGLPSVVGNLNASADLRVSYYSTPTAVYPSTSASDSVNALASVIPGPPAVLIRVPGAITVPAGAAYARVVLTTVITSGGASGDAVAWDRVILRRVG